VFLEHLQNLKNTKSAPPRNYHGIFQVKKMIKQEPWGGGRRDVKVMLARMKGRRYSGVAAAECRAR